MDESLAPPGRFQLDHAPSEITALVEFLDIHRLEFHERVWGLTDDQLRQTAAASNLTLGGLVKHMALVEHSWFEHRFLGMDEREPWASAPWDDDEDWEFIRIHHALIHHDYMVMDIQLILLLSLPMS